MIKVKNILGIKNIVFFTLFVILFLLEYYLVSGNERKGLLIPRLSIIILLIGYYLISEKKKVNIIFLLFLFSLFPVNILFSYNDQSVLAMLFLALSRITLIFLSLYNYKFEKRPLYITLILVTFIAVVILLINYKNNAFFYSSVIPTLFLIFLLAIAYTKLLSSGTKNGNLEFFLAMCSFFLSDAVFGSKKVDAVVPVYLILGSLFYYIAYMLIMFSILNRRNNINLIH